MAIVTNSSGGNTTVTITYVASNAKVSSVLTDAAHFVWQDFNGTTWDTSTTNQRLAQLDIAIKNVVVEWAKAYNLQSDIETARLASIAENSTNYSLG